MFTNVKEQSSEMEKQGSNFQADISAKVTELIKTKKHLNLIKGNDKKNLRSRSVL